MHTQLAQCACRSSHCTLCMRTCMHQPHATPPAPSKTIILKFISMHRAWYANHSSDNSSFKIYLRCSWARACTVNPSQLPASVAQAVPTSQPL
mmetsp:Transcript_1790/g.3960  ORF Transcript_1790/g.3960 Transcript_1790/m.3960 type:complete len:93 (-) Transcript_1790:2447-2725(-)